MAIENCVSNNFLSTFVDSIDVFDFRFSGVLLFWKSRTRVVVVFVFNVPPTAKVIWRWGHSLKSHPTDW